MKRVLLAILILFLPLVSSLSIEMKENFQPGETLIASIEGNFLSPINQDNIYFYSDRVSMPITFDIARINEKYYIYALLPVQEKNYTLIIKDVNYYENAQEKTIDLTNDFLVSGNITDFSVYPGFIITKENFTITTESMNKALTISSSILNQTKTILVQAGQKKKTDFKVKSENFTLTSLSLSYGSTQYSIPVVILSSSGKTTTIKNETINITESDKFSFTKSDYNFSANKGTESKFDIYLKNVGSSEIKDITISVSNALKDIISISPSSLDLTESDSEKIELTVNSDSEGVFRGTIKAISGNLSTISDITINLLSSEAPLPPPPAEEESCIYYGGIVCASNEQCRGTNKDESSDPNCCIGVCEAKKSYTGTIIGVILIIALGVGLFLLYKRSKSKKSGKSEEVIKEKSKVFESRLAGKEERGSLSRS